MDGPGTVFIEKLDGLPKLRAANDGIVHKEQILVPDQLRHRDLLHLGNGFPVDLCGRHKATRPGRRVLDERAGKVLAALVGVADGMGRAGIRNAADVVDLLHVRLVPVRPGEDRAVAVAHGFHIDPFIGGRWIAVVGPEERADALLFVGRAKLRHAFRGQLDDLAGAELLLENESQLFISEGLEGNGVAVFAFSHGNGEPSEPVAGSDQRAVLLQDQNGSRAVDGFLGKADALRKVRLLVDQRNQKLHDIDRAAGLGVEVTAGEGEKLVDQRIRVVDPADHTDGIGAVIGTDQQGLRLAVADAADRRSALHLFKDVLEAGAEGCVLDAVDLALQTDLRIVRRHPAAACAEMRMVVGAEKDVCHAVLFGCNAEKASHMGTS